LTATGVGAKSVLELGTGTGETARRVLNRHPDAQLIGIDASPGMVKVARASLPADRVKLVVGRLEDPLPEGSFDLVVSALAVHHLEGTGKADLFRRIASMGRLRSRRRRLDGINGHELPGGVLSLVADERDADRQEPKESRRPANEGKERTQEEEPRCDRTRPAHEARECMLAECGE